MAQNQDDTARGVAERSRLRRAAEARLDEAKPPPCGPHEAGDPERLLHELSVHQIELEMQNDELRTAEQELSCSRDRYARLYEGAPVGFVTVGATGHVVLANRAAVTLLVGEDGGQPSALFGRSPAAFVAPCDVPVFERALARVLQHQGEQSVEVQVAGGDGRPPTWLLLRMVSTPDEEAGVECQIALTDISERLHLEESRSNLAAIVESSDDAIVGRDLDGTVVSWNRAAEQLFGISASEIIGQTMDALVPPPRRAEELELLQRLRQGERVPHFDSERLAKDGSLRCLSISLSPVRDGHGRVTGSALIARDMSQRRRADEALRQRVRQLDLLSHAGQSLILSASSELPLHSDLFDRVRETVGADVQLVYALDAANGSLRLRSSHGLPEATRDKLVLVGLDDSLCGLAAPRTAYLLVDHLQQSDLPAARTLKEAGVRCYAGFPLGARGEVYGVVAFASTSQDEFRGSDVMVIRSVCDQVSAMLERARLMEDLREREKTLERADRAKNEFIATLAHELRNPLAPIRNAVSLMRHGTQLDAAALTWCHEIVDRQVHQITHLLEDLLDVSRLSRHSVVLRRERTALSQPVEQAVEATRAVMQTRGHELELRMDAAPVLLYADPTRLTQVFTNLLDNAAKYTQPGGRVTLAVERDGDTHVRVTVRDSGVGIEPEFLPHVFEMFSPQQQGQAERPAGGLGIGLSLSRGLVVLHEGTIEAFSAGAGQGSEFVVRLPALAAEPAVAVAGGATVEPALPRLRVLVVDDNADAAQTLGAVLECEQQDVRTAFTGNEALRMARRWHPDVAVLDIGLPDIDGYALCERMREQALLRGDAPPLMIACTGRGQEHDRALAREAGFEAHLVKPVDPMAVLQAIAQLRRR